MAPDNTGFRARVRDMLARRLPDRWAGIGSIPDRADAEAFMSGWRKVLFEEGLLAVAWPKRYGGAGLGRVEQVVLVEELAKAGVPAMGPSDVFGIKMLGNTLLRWGTEEQRAHYLPPDPLRRGHLVPGLLGARLRIGSGQPAHERGAGRR